LPNVGGGFQSGLVLEGNTPADQTIFNFFNRTNPGIIKVCKIAGRGVPIGTRFLFEVRGREAGPAGGPILPGQDVVRYTVVSAGPASQGGFCSIVTDDPDGPTGAIEGGAPTRFIVGTLALAREIAVLDDVAGVEHGAFGDPLVNPEVVPGFGSVPVTLNHTNDGAGTTPDSEVRVSRIRVNGVNGTNVTGSQTVQGVTLGNTAAGNTNPNLWSDQSATAITNRRSVIFRVGRGETVVDFVNRLFRPTQLKVCKVAGTGVPVGTPFTFSFSIDTEGGLVPGQTNEPISVANVTIPAGDPAISSQGNCAIINGPYETNEPLASPNFGTFDVGSVVTVTEGGTTNVVVTSPTATSGNFTQSGRSGIITLQYPGGFNELIFVNSAGAPASTGFSLSGRVMTPDGGGLRNAQVIVVGEDGSRTAVPTSSMGYYNIGDLPTQKYTVSVSSRRYRFASREVELNSSLANVDFTGIE
jgi:hypothetical protein